jgi:hypothetical protein
LRLISFFGIRDSPWKIKIYISAVRKATE